MTPARHQPGTRRYRGNCTRFSGVTVNATAPEKGYCVSSAIVTATPSPTLAETVPGAYMTAASPLPGVAIQVCFA